MADNLKMDPARIARLRDPVRLEQVDPERVLEVVTPAGVGPIVDVGAGVGFVTLPFARRFPESRVIACDLLPGMLEALAQGAGWRNRQSFAIWVTADLSTLSVTRSTVFIRQ